MRRWARPPLTSRWRRLVSRVFEVLARGRRDADLDEEIAAHLDLAAAEQHANGVPAEEARAAAERSFGGVLRAKEAYRDGRGFPWLDAVLQDARFALRGFRKNPSFTVVAILTLALAIGANTAIFSIVYGALIKPLPYQDANRLVLIRGAYQLAGSHALLDTTFTPAAMDEWHARLHTIGPFAYFTNGTYGLSRGDGSDVLDTAVVSSNFFSTLSGRFAAGRPLGPADQSTPSIVISERLARRLFGQSEAAIGGSLTLNARPYTVVGVADETFQFPSSTTDVWSPADYARIVNLHLRDRGFRLLARLNPGITIEQARVEVEDTARALSTVDPKAFSLQLGAQSGTSLHTSVIGLRRDLLGNVRPVLMMLWATVGLVLLVACANLANLMLARHTARVHETAVRLALGASRGRLLARELTDSALLSAAGTTAGLALALAAVVALRRWTPEAMPWLAHVQLDRPVLLFAAALGIVTTIGTGMLPAAQSAQMMPTRHVRPGATAPGGRRLRRALCVLELAAAIVLLVGATLLGRSLAQLLRADIGVNTDHVMTASINLAFGPRPSEAETRQRIERVIARIRTLPGVRAVGAGTALPPDTSRVRVTFSGVGKATGWTASDVSVTPDYLQALGMRLLSGRFFTKADDLSDQPVMIMSANTARRYFSDKDPLGQTLPLPSLGGGPFKSRTAVLVGIVADVKYSGLAAEPDDQIYAPFAQQPFPSASLAIRMEKNLSNFPATLRRTIASVDPTIVVSSVQTLDEIVATDAAPSRFRTALLVSFAGLALLIAAVGLYGVIAYSVAQRTMEIGIRMALGARTADVMRMVLREGAVLGFIGVAIGLAAAYGTTRLLASLLYGVTATDPLSFALAAAILLAIALVASYLPARRAAQVDPLVALRTE